jgi:hypothetical protein
MLRNNWETTRIHAMDIRTRETEQEVQNIIDLQRITNQLPEAFTNTKGIMKSHIPAVNAPERIDIPFEEDSSKPFQLKSSTSNPRKRGSLSASVQNESNIKAPTNISRGCLKRSKREPKNK